MTADDPRTTSEKGSLKILDAMGAGAKPPGTPPAPPRQGELFVGGAGGADRTPAADSPRDGEHAAPGELGELEKLRALSTHVARYGNCVRAAQAAMLRILLERGAATIEDVRAALSPPPAGNPRWLGAVPHGLRTAGLIRRAGFVEAARRAAHRRPVSIWELADPAAARAWLRGHGDGGVS